MFKSNHSASVVAGIFASGKYSDLKTTCQGSTFNVHRNVVCQQSKVIAAMIDGQFSEGTIGVVDLPTNDPDVVQRMIHFFYHGTYPTHLKRILERDTGVSDPTEDPELHTDQEVTEAKPDSAPGSVLLVHVHVYAIAEQYDIPTLKLCVTQKYARDVVSLWNTTGFTKSLCVMYDTTPQSDRLLKDIAMKTAGPNAKKLWDRGEFIALCKENGDICFDVLAASFVDLVVGKDCPGCGEPGEFRSADKKTKYHCRVVACSTRYYN